jgi:hypothetical protein
MKTFTVARAIAAAQSETGTAESKLVVTGQK